MEVDEEVTFTWEAYLEETKSTTVPPTAFLHVEQSLENLFKLGTYLEVESEGGSYWPAQVAMTCGPLLSLRFLGEPRSTFFYDAAKREFHPLGWAARNSRPLVPPTSLKTLIGSDINSFLRQGLKNATSVPVNMVKQIQSGAIHVDQIRTGLMVELQDQQEPGQVWFATVMKNVGGRLLLRYAGLDTEEHDIWCFYLQPLLHPLGWAPHHGCLYHPPRAVQGLHPDQEWKKICATYKGGHSNTILPEILKPQTEVLPNPGFRVGMRLEALEPVSRSKLCPATVVKVLGRHFFLVEAGGSTLCCHGHSSTIFPVHWASRRSLPISDSSGGATYDWATYLQHNKAATAPAHFFHLDLPNPGFECGAKLECVHPLHPHKICVATVVKVESPLLVLRLDTDPKQEFLVPLDSMELFPAGWSESNGYSIISPPLQSRPPAVTSATGETKVASNRWCPKIFFNHRCFTGPHLSKGRLAELPRAVGPGPVVGVLREVLAKLVSIAYKPTKVLRFLESSRPSTGHDLHQLKAKYKGKLYQSEVEIVRHGSQVEEFCRKTCLKLECCPHLFGPFFISSECPKKCHRNTKTKFTNHVYKKGNNKKEVKTFEVRKKKKRRHYWQLLHHREEEKADPAKQKEPEPTKPAVQTPAKSPAQTTAKSPAKSPAQTSAKSPAQTSAKSPAQTSAKSPAQTSAKSQAQTTSKSQAQTTSKSPAQTTKSPAQTAKSPAQTAKSPAQTAKSAAQTSSKTPVQTAKSPVQRPFSYRFNWHRQRAGRVGRTSGGVVAPAKFNPTSRLPQPQEAASPPQSSPSPPAASKMEAPNLMGWSVQEVVRYLENTDCAPIAKILGEHAVDGQALLLLTLPHAQEFLHLRLSAAVKLCSIVEKMKLSFMAQNSSF